MAGDGMEVSASGGGGGNKQPQISLLGLFLACMVAGGVQYGWALQLSLLTPYVQVYAWIYLCVLLLDMMIDEYGRHFFTKMFFFALSPSFLFVLLLLYLFIYLFTKLMKTFKLLPEWIVIHCYSPVRGEIISFIYSDMMRIMYCCINISFKVGWLLPRFVH